MCRAYIIVLEFKYEIIICITNVSNTYTNFFHWYLQVNGSPEDASEMQYFCNWGTPVKVPILDVVVGLAWPNDPELCLMVVTLLVWHHMPDRSKVMIQTKRDTLVLRVGHEADLTP